MPKPRISVIVVNYRTDDLVRAAKRRLTAVDIEVIVIDHSDGKEGYGAGCNDGARQATGEYLVFMNPDVEITADQVKQLIKPLSTDQRIGMVGPRFTHEEQTQITCSEVPTPLMALIEYSFLRKFPLLSHWTKAYRLNGFDHLSSRMVPAISGACFAMRASDFAAIGGCDEKLFLYFEEFDLASRLQAIGKSVYFLGDVAVEHRGQVSTQQLAKSKRLQIFQTSRRYWLRKRWGFSGLVVAQLLEMGEKWPR